MTHEEGLTTFARKVDGARMTDLLASDARNADEPVTFIAKRAFTEMEGSPVLVLEDGQS